MKRDRHTKVEVNCVWCGNLFQARTERVAKGQGRFCGKECFDNWQRKQKQDTIWGRKDLATCYNIGGRYTARWYDKNGKIKSTPYPRWWWEMNVGEIPDGMIILHKDNNPMNIDPSNFELGTKSDALIKSNATRKSNTQEWAEYRNKASIRQTQMWKDGKFENLRGKNHYNWRGGTSKDVYPNEFYEIRDFVKSRDNFMCQVCGKSIATTPRSGHVHHRDGNKQNSDQDNLLLLCVSCHAKVHSQVTYSPPIMALRSELHWDTK